MDSQPVTAKTGGPVEVRTLADLAAAAIARGELGTFDYALPHQWCMAVMEATGIWPMGFVWSYPPRSIFGEPFPLTDEAKALLAQYNAPR